MLHFLIQRDQTAQFTIVSTRVWLFAFNYNRHLFLGSKCQLSGDGPDADGKDNLICGESAGLTGPSLFFVFVLSFRPTAGSCQRVRHAPAGRLGNCIVGSSGGRYNHWLFHLATGNILNFSCTSTGLWAGKRIN